MAERKKLGLREVRALKPGQIAWDPTLPGFGARRQRSEAVAYVVVYRTVEGRQRWHTIGRHGAPWTPETARAAALAVLGKVVAGGDPAAEKRAKRRAETMSELLDQYWADATSGRLLTRRGAAKKASTLLSDRGRIEGHIRPLLGTMKVPAVTREDIESFMNAVAEGKTAKRAGTGKLRGVSNVRGGRGVAARTVSLLSAIFAYAVRHRMRPDNPCSGVVTPADRKRERRLSDAEYAALGTGLRQAERTVWPAAVATARFLALTGWRSGEALGLTWDAVDVDKRTAILADTKTGRSLRPLSEAACDVLAGLPRTGDLVFPATRRGVRMTGFPAIFARIVRMAGLSSDITPHVLRHSFASLAGDMGMSEPTIAALIGHKGGTITSRYTHLADAPLLAAADAVAAETLARMTPPV